MVRRVVGVVAVVGLALATARADVLNVAIVGPGTGTVESSPAGISCPGTCSADFPSGTSVTLRATPDPGFRFDNWSRACGGPVPGCVVTVAPDLGVVAGFREIDDPLSVIHHFTSTVVDGAGPAYGRPVSDGTWLYGATRDGGQYNAGVVFRQRLDGSDFELLHSFTGSGTDGQWAFGSLTLDGDVLYGMTYNGGASRVGTVFRINTDGSGFGLIHSFRASFDDGMRPLGSLTQDGDVLYGMTQSGGAHGRGIVFKVDTDGSDFAVIHSFAGDSTDGGSPWGSLTLDGGVLFGMTGDYGPLDCGTIFRVDTDGSNYVQLHAFGGNGTGAWPHGSLTLDGGVLYGMSRAGGSSHQGTIFRIGVDGAGFALLHSFAGGSADGGGPTGSLTLNDGALFGMTQSGGALGTGTVFQIDVDGSDFALLHNFGDATTDGKSPAGSLTLDGGVLYGMTYRGGTSDMGTVFRLDQTGSKFELLHSFAGSSPDSRAPYGSLALGGGVLYGMTSSGGASDRGTIYRVDVDGSDFALLHTFSDAITDGGEPLGAPTADGDVLYGMTSIGGTAGYGTVFRIATDGSDFELLHSFAGSPDGRMPYGSLTLGDGVLYGMTSDGGYGAGTVFRVATDGSSYAVLHMFGQSSTDGLTPYGSLILSGGVLYGMTSSGGTAWDEGTVFKINTDGSDFELLHSFTRSSSDGGRPSGSLTLDGSVLYGMTRYGGSGEAGVVFRIATDGSGFAVLRSFNLLYNGTGHYPYGSLALQGDDLFGVTYEGGPSLGEGTIFRIATDGSAFRMLHSLHGWADDGGRPFYVAPLIDAGVLYVPTRYGGIGDAGAIVSYRLVPDVTPPTDPTIDATDPPLSSWSNDTTVELSFSGATDDVAVAGYSILYDMSPTSHPDDTLEVFHNTDPQRYTSPALGDGDSWYGHLSTCDTSGNCTSTVHVGPFLIDATSPTAPSPVSSPSHGAGPAADDTIDIAWPASADGGSGVSGYRWDVTASASPPACSALANTTAGLGATTGVLADGDYWAHVCAVDQAGNGSVAVTAGPYTVDTTPPAPPVITGIQDDTGASANDGITSDDTLVMNGTAEDGATVEVFVDGGAIGTTTSAGGAWSLDHTATPLGEGGHSVTAAATDAALNASSLSAGFAVTVDETAPTVLRLETVARTEGGFLPDGGSTMAGITQLGVVFGEAMEAPLAPADFRVIARGPSGDPPVVGCASPLKPGDIELGISEVSWLDAGHTAWLTMASGHSLAAGDYGVMVCAGVRDLAGNALDGNGDGTPGDDHARSFRVIRSLELVNPNFDRDLAGWTVEPAGAMTVSHSPDDSDGMPTSGSLSLDGSAGPSEVTYVRQCVDAPSPNEYLAAAWLRNTSDIAVLVTLQATAYPEVGCGSGPPVQLLDSRHPVEGRRSEWTLIGDGVTAPEGTASVELLVAVRPLSLHGQVDVLLDTAVFAVELGEVIFVDGFERGDTGFWSATVPAR